MVTSAEVRRAKDAERKRVARAAAARERQERLDAEASARPPGTEMQDELAKALDAMEKWLAASDGAAIAQARMIAKLIDRLTHEGDVVKALNAHGRLTRVLTELGGTPTVRMARELRSLKAVAKQGAKDERDTGEGKAGGAAVEGGNVSRFQRPAKRKA